jgi:heme a synthase
LTLAFALAVATTAATFVLILAGGLVTNTGAALAVPDWPTTFGHNMFLFPWSGMVGGVLYEHSHRLLGALVGLLTLALAAVLWCRGALLRGLGLVAMGAVLVQGVIGGLRVVLLQDALAIVHGALAQAFFGLLATIAFLTSRYAGLSGPVDRRSGGVGSFSGARALALLAAGLIYAQILLGALLTHAGFLGLHLAGALLVYAFVPVVAARLSRSGDPVAGVLARTLLVLLGVQLLLGAGALVARFMPVPLPGGQAMVLALPVAHRLVAGLLLAAATVLAVRATAAAGTAAARPAASPTGTVPSVAG